MSRFDNEIIKQAENAYQQMVGEGHTTTPRQQPYNQIDTVGTDSAPGVFQAPAPVDEMADWVANTPAVRTIQVTDLDAADPAQPGAMGEIIGGPGSSAVYAEGGPVYATKNPFDESLYNVYKASREIRDAIESQIDFDFSRLITASNDASTVFRFASANDDVNNVVGTVASIVLEIENDLASNGDYRQASADLVQLESLLEDINKVASSDSDDDCTCDGKGTCKSCKEKTSAKKSKSKKESCKHCKGKGCKECEDDDEDEDDDKPAFLKKKKSARTEWCKGPGCKIEDCDGKTSKEATNGNQETLQVVDVRDLDDQAGLWDRERVTTPDHVTNVLVPEKVNGEDAGYVPFYNDGAETGIIPQQGPHHQEVFPYDGTNPAFVPYGNVAGAVQASREKIFAAIQVVDRLEKLGMVQHDDRAKHIAKFEQMSDSKLAGFVDSIDMLEESGARQPRSQKVASGSNRLPEMGRLTTASTVKRQDVLADDWLMTL